MKKFFVLIVVTLLIEISTDSIGGVRTLSRARKSSFNAFRDISCTLMPFKCVIFEPTRTVYILLAFTKVFERTLIFSTMKP